VGATGTELVLACASETRPTLNAVREALDEHAGPWPAMAPQTGIRLDRDGAHFVGLRGLGAMRAPPDSAYAKAKDARSRLAERFDWVAGWVFPHAETAP
jgi:hypothetical protein